MTEPVPAPALTAPVEDYLKAVYELEQKGGPAGTNDVAAALQIAPASASGMLRRLAETGLIAHEPYRGARLTEAGRRAALRTIRRHRVIESYLATALGYPWDRVHEEAEQLEHSASDELVDRMAAAIGEPATDPHGAPIPRRDGTMDERRLGSLDDLDPGVEARVQLVEDKDAGRLRYLAGIGITPGAVVQVVSKAPFDGPIGLRVEGNRERGAGKPSATEQTIGSALAKHVLVLPVPRVTSKDASAPRSGPRGGTGRPAAKPRGRRPNDRHR